MYKVQNLVSGKEYIGITIDPERRWRQHKTLNTQCSALKDAIRKYGVDNFKFELLCCGEDSYIDDLEVKAIERFKTQTPNGYNITLGGDGANYTRWNDDWNKLLGTKPDKDLAEELGVSYHALISRRHGLKITSYAESVKFDWIEYDHLLGTMSDNRVADIIGTSPSSVGYRRNELGISPYKRSQDYIITDDIIKLFGIKSDPYISEKFKIPICYIKNKRKEIGIKSASNSSWVSERDWSEWELSKIKDTSLTTIDLSKLLSISRTTVQKKRKELDIKFDRKYKDIKYPVTEEMKEDLLNLDNTIQFIANKYGMNWSTANRKREKLLNE